MLKKVNLKESADSIEKLFEYLRVGTLNNHMLNVLQAENRTLDFHVHEFSASFSIASKANLILKRIMALRIFLKEIL